MATRPVCRMCMDPLGKFIRSVRDQEPPPEAQIIKRETVRELRGDSWQEIPVIDYWMPGAWGYHGNGYFCTLRCGYRFAVWTCHKSDRKKN